MKRIVRLSVALVLSVGLVFGSAGVVFAVDCGAECEFVELARRHPKPVECDIE